MRHNYRVYPIDYINELHQGGIRGRKKAMAFMSYWHDMELGEHNSIAFYAKIWNVSKSTAWTWIKEFSEEIDKFLSNWQLRNAQHYNYVQNSTERQPNESNAHEPRIYGHSRNSAERQPNQDYNIYDDDNNIGMHADKNFADLFFIYRLNTKYGGRKEDAYREWLKVKDKVSYEELKRAIVLYLHDPSVSKHYNFANFLKNEVYLSYIPKRLRVKVQDEWITGTYKDDQEMFVSDDGKPYKLTPERLAELFSKGELEFVR